MKMKIYQTKIPIQHLDYSEKICVGLGRVQTNPEAHHLPEMSLLGIIVPC